jgi:hypothetical protein
MIKTYPKDSNRKQRCKDEDETNTKKNTEMKTQEIRDITRSGA